MAERDLGGLIVVAGKKCEHALAEDSISDTGNFLLVDVQADPFAIGHDRDGIISNPFKECIL